MNTFMLAWYDLRVFLVAVFGGARTPEALVTFIEDKFDQDEWYRGSAKLSAAL
jgi:hypothetical protein